MKLPLKIEVRVVWVKTFLVVVPRKVVWVAVMTLDSSKEVEMPATEVSHELDAELGEPPAAADVFQVP